MEQGKIENIDYLYYELVKYLTNATSNLEDMDSEEIKSEIKQLKKDIDELNIAEDGATKEQDEAMDKIIYYAASKIQANLKKRYNI